jgi:lipopolysaccharide export system permease protein
MTSLTRYILRQSFAVMILVSAALCAAIWLAQSLRLIDLIVNRGLSAGAFLYLALLTVPRFLDVVLPIGAFIAVLFTFNRMIAESEMVIMRAAGLGPWALARPVMILAVIAFSFLMSLSLYFLPVANREFKDVLFEIRNRFVSGLIQEGTFTTISNKLTIYVKRRESDGELSGILINDSRDPQRPITVLAERGAVVDVAGGSRIVLLNGEREQYNRASKKLSVLTFARYTLDLDTMRDAPVVRFREPEERFLGELFSPPSGISASLRHNFLAEGSERIIVPLSVFSFVMIALACLLPGQIRRRGQSRHVLLAVAFALLFQGLEASLRDLATRSTAMIPLMYLIVLLPILVAFAVLSHDRLGLPLRRLKPAAS